MKWVWVKIEAPGDRRFSSMFPFARVPCWADPIFDPQLNVHGHVFLALKQSFSRACREVKKLPAARVNVNKGLWDLILQRRVMLHPSWDLSEPIGISLR